MSDTPRTDDAELHYRQVCEDKDMPSYLVPADFARQLERENAALKEAINRLVDRFSGAAFGDMDKFALDHARKIIPC